MEGILGIRKCSWEWQ